MIDGLVVIDKPAGRTSHDVVARCRRIAGQKRVGHAGTLDPSATGVLLVAFGRATRLMQFVSALPKTYVGEIVLGRTTTTLDDEGGTVEEFDMSNVVIDDVRSAAAEFVGDIEQIPPMVSAVKVGGRRLHELAREGVTVERKPRPVTIHSIDVEPADDAGVFRLHVQCSSGTYIRTLAADIGEALGGGAHLRRLRRTAIGGFSVDAAVALDDLEGSLDQHLLDPLAMVGHLEPVKADDDMVTTVGHGKPIDASVAGVEGDGPFAIVAPDGRLLAVYNAIGKSLRPEVVLAAN